MSKVRNGEVRIVTPLDDLKQNTDNKLQTFNKTQYLNETISSRKHSLPAKLFTLHTSIASNSTLITTLINEAHTTMFL